MISDNSDTIKREKTRYMKKIASPKVTQNKIDGLSSERRAKAKARIIEALDKSGGHIGKAVEAAGVARATFYEWIKSDNEFKTKAYDIIDHKIDNVEFALYSTALKGNVTAQIFYLKNKRSEKWKDSHNLDASLNFIDRDKMQEAVRSLVDEFNLLK